MRQNQPGYAQKVQLQSQQQRRVPSSSKGVPVISRPSHQLMNATVKGAAGMQAAARTNTMGIMGSAPGSMQQISTSEVRKMRKEIQNLRDANADLKDALHEARQDFLMVQQERDSYKGKLMLYQKDVSQFDAIVQAQVAKALESTHKDLQAEVASQKAQIEKLTEHNRCYKETIEYLESQLKHTTADLTKASMTLAQSFNRSKGVHLESMLQKVQEDQGGDTSGCDRDETQLNQQDSEPSPLGVSIFGKQKSLNMVAPYDFPEEKEDRQKKQALPSRYNKMKEADLDGDFSRDEGEEDIGIGYDEDEEGVRFDDEDLFGEQKGPKNNRSKMLLDELDLNETEQDLRQQTMHNEDETGALNSDRAMVPNERKRGKGSTNALTRSQALPNSSTKDGSMGDKSGRSQGGGGGLLGLSGINLDFRKSGNGLKSFFQKSSHNQGAAGLSKSIQFTYLEKQ